MPTTLTPSGQEPLPDHPFAIPRADLLCDATALQALIRQAIPMLQHSEAYDSAVRSLGHRISQQ